jgi:hypothetical protein
MSLTMYQTNQWDYLINKEDHICNECKSEWIEEECNRCGEGVCMNDKCCEKFPHYHNTKFIICRECATEIEKKLHILEDDEKKMCMDLKLLKKKIKKRMKMKIKQLEE